MDIEAKISPLIENMFPAFYKEYGESFIMFVQAYYEWLEQNHQLLTLEDNTNFNIGDTVTQQNVTGTIIAYDGSSIVVLVDGFETFKCYNVCNELIPITSSSGGDTYILRGGTTRRMGPLFLARNLLKMRDIDSTIDLFVLRFKEKYLKNIEFDVKTNKPLLVKNALDLYKAKGTARAVDLFFRLVYGVGATVYTPGEAVFRPSDAEWVKPQYLEITGTQRAVELVGKQITGRTSGATAFVEKYIKRKIKDGIVHVLYLSNIRGDFVNREILQANKYYGDLPIVVGSLTSVEIISGSSSFEVGDIVSFQSVRGGQAIGRVANVATQTGIVDFTLLDGGYGYTVSGLPTLSESELEKRTQSIVSEKVLRLSNVVTSNTIDTIIVNAGGSGYDNTDIVKVVSNYSNAVANPVTDANGSILAITISNTGSGFYTLNPAVTVTNSTGGSTSGSSANLVAITKAQPTYFKYFEPLVQTLITIDYNSATNNQLLVPGQSVYVGNSSVNNAFGIIISNANNTLVNANGVLTIAVSNNGTIAAGNTIYLTSNASITANVANVTSETATSTVMGLPNTATFTLSDIIDGTIARDDEVYQIDTSGIETGNAKVQATSLATTAGTIVVDQLNGVIGSGRTLRVRNRTTTANVTNVSLTVGVYNVVNDYSNSFNVPIWTQTTGTVANVEAVSSGTGAGFKVRTIGETEFVYLNTDFLGANNYPSAGANQEFMSLPINALEYGFPKNPQGNSDTIIFSCLNFDSFEVGTIASLTAINPGENYNIQPYVLAYQPYLAGFDFHNYMMTIENADGIFTVGERILQTNTTFEEYNLYVSDETGYVIGEKVYQGTSPSETATGIVSSIVTTANTIVVREVTGTFNTGETLNSYINPSLSANVLSVSMDTRTSTAKGIIQFANTSTIYVKRIQFDDLFTVGSQIQGSQSRSTANIVTITETTDLPIGLNAEITANVITANGTVTSIQIQDSGIGYSNGEIMLYVSEDGQRAGEAKAVVAGVGTGSGYYRTTKGFLSSTSKLHDGDYYQEYSYEVLSRIPLDTYADMFKKVIHTAGTRFFGGVLIEDVLNVDVIEAQADMSKHLFEVGQFNSNTNVVNSSIVLDNTHANNSLIFNNGDRVKYYTTTGNTVVQPLANNTWYYVSNALSTSIQLQTNPRVWSYTFNAKTNVASNFITIERHSLADGDVVAYTTNAGNTAITGLANNGVYHVVSANTSGVKLAATRGGSPIALTPSTTSESGHTLAITRINIVANSTSSGASTNGHFIVHSNEL